MLAIGSLIESRNPAGDLLGPQGLLSLVSTIDATKPADLISELLGQIAKLYPENLTDDDVTVLVVRPTGAGTTVPLINRLKAPWLFLGGCVRALLSGNRLPLPEFTWANLGGSMLDGLGRAVRPGSRKSMPGRTRE